MKIKTKLMEKKRDLENQIQHRSEPVEFDIKEDRTIEFPFSSEKPVYRGVLGNEILDHREGSIDFSRLNDAAPLLFNHNPDKPIGVVEKAWTKDKRGYARVRFSDNPFPSEVYNDVKNGILRGVSVGYSVNETREEEDKKDSYRVTSWTPAEISIAVVAADESVGVGRAKEAEEKIDNNIAMPAKQESSNMEAQRINDVKKAASVASQKQTLSTEKMTDTPDLSVVRSEERKKAQQEERSRITNISALGAQHGCEDLATTLVESGASIDEARAAVLERIGAKPVETVSQVDLNQERNIDYKLTSGIRAALTGDWSSKEAGYVRELSQEVERSGIKKTSERSFLVPYTALTKRATYNTGSAGTGGSLVATDLYADDFIEALRNSSKMMSLGVKALPGLVGDVALPRRSGVASTYYLSTETTAITQAESTFDQVTMTPKNLAALSKYSRQTLLTATPGIEQLIRDDLTDGLNTAVDLGILNGAGSGGAPTGIMQTSGIGSVAIGTNGGAITIETLVDLEEQVLIDNGNVSDSMAYVTNAKVLAELKKLRAGGSASGDGSFLWNTDPASLGRGGTPGSVNGYPLAVTNQVPSNLTKGSSSSVCSAVLIGDFSQATVGFWGSGLEITVGEDADDFSKALSSVRGIITYDVAVRHAESFAACLDVTT
jgi:HK97 family phage major capsid protein/HK97 family phage prohead protease